MKTLPSGRADGRRPTMRDVANVAGVSISTVSRAINADPRVDPELAARVRQAAELLRYRRDHAAATLRRADRQTASIGIIFEDVSNPFFSAVHRGIEEVARDRGVLTLAGSADDDPERERELVEAFGARNVDGLILAPCTEDHGYLQTERESGTVLVFVDRPAQHLGADCVLADNAGGAREAVLALLDAGHRRIGYLGDRQRIFTASERLRGYRDALRTRGIPEDAELVRLELPGAQAAHAAVRELLEGPAPPTALFTAQNLITVGAVAALRALDRQREVALIGFDDLELSEFIEPGLTVVAQDPVSLGRLSAEFLFSRFDGYDGPPRHAVVPTSFIRRGSGELPAPAPAS